MTKKGKLGIILITSSLFILFTYHLYYYLINKKEVKLIENYYVKENKQEDYNYTVVKNTYLGILKIPQINLEKGFLDINDKDNNINKNIQILENSTMPDNPNHLLLIAAHSGNSLRSYFKDLDKLNINDEINIYYDNKRYNYQVYDIQNIPKDGTLEVYQTFSATLVLTTCNQKDKSKQILVYAKLINIDT